MRLRTKLTIVLAMLISTLAFNVVLSVWSIRFLERELSLPLRSMESVLQRLHAIKRAGEDEIDRVLRLVSEIPRGAGSVDETAARVRTIEQQNQRILDELEALPSVMLRSGITTIENLRSRAVLIDQANNRWVQSGDGEDGRHLVALIDARHELIERVEGRILDDAQLAGDFGESLKRRIYSILLVTLIGALGIGLLMVMFIRRWVFSPIEQLRSGTQRMAMGYFDQPIEVTSNDELGQLSDEFNRMGVLVQEMQQRRIEQERFAAMGEMAQRTVHNLRTPLSGIRALSETTLQELEPGSDLRDLQSRIIATVDRFELWLAEMLRTSSPLELQMGVCNPCELVGSVIESHRGASESKEVEIDLVIEECPEVVRGDAHHLEHAITAILSNAIEYAPEGSRIEVRLGQAEGLGDREKDTYWTLRVANMGAMIPEDLHRAIFRPYFTTRRSGTGIGLAMAHRVIGQHHGVIDVESPLDIDQQCGAAFVIRVPITGTDHRDDTFGQ